MLRTSKPYTLFRPPTSGRHIHIGFRKMANVADTYNGNQLHHPHSHSPMLTSHPRSHPHSSNRRHWPPIPPRLHPCRDPQPRDPLGLSLLSHQHPPPHPHQLSKPRTHSLHLPPRPVPPARPARSPLPRQHRRSPTSGSPEHHRVQCCGESAGRDQA